MFNLIGTWFGYVGACVVSPDATCRPFLAFVVLGIAAGVALTLVLLAYRRGYAHETVDLEERRTRQRTLELQERVRRTLVGQPVVPKPTVERRLRVAA